MTKNIFKSVMAFGAFALAFSVTSCQKSPCSDLPQLPVDPSNEVTISGIVEVEQEDGSYVAFPAEMLRGADDTYGTWSGLGTYPANTTVTVQFTSASPWYIYSFFEKAAGENSGLTQNRSTMTKSTSVTVTRNATYVAKVRKMGNLAKDVTVTTKPGNFDYKGGSQEIAVSVTEITPILDKSGAKVGEEKVPGKTPTVVTVKNKPDWATVTPSGSDKKKIIVQVGANTTTARTTDGNRSGEVVLVVDGKEVKVALNQESGFEINNTIAPADNEWVMTTGTKPGATYRHSFVGDGGTWDLASENANFAQNTCSIKVAVYINGKLAPQDKWLTKTGTWSYGAPSQPWVTNTAQKYTAQKNITGRSRTVATAEAVLKFGAHQLLKSNLVMNQTADGFIVDGEIQ